MTDYDPNEAYEVVPIEPGPHGPPKGWWTVKRNGHPVRHFPGKEKAHLSVLDLAGTGTLSRPKTICTRRRRQIPPLLEKPKRKK